MFFQELKDLKLALNQLKLELIPTLQTEIATLQSNSVILSDLEIEEVDLSIAVIQLSNDTNAMIRMLKFVLIPLVDALIENPSHKKSIQSFDILRIYHKRIIAHLNELREMCNQHIIGTDWSYQKKVSCLNVYHSEQAFLKYVNFMETTLFSLLTPYVKEKVG